MTAARLLCLALGGTLYSLPFIQPSLGLLAFVGFAPALLALPDLLGTRRLFFALLPAAIAAAIAVIPMLRMSVAAMVVIAVFVFLPWFWGALFSFAWLRRRTGWPMALLWPCCWVVAEWGWSFHSLGRLAYALSAYSVFRYPALIQVADVTGVLGVSFVIQAIVGGLADVATALHGSRASERRLARSLAPLFCALALLAVCLGYGAMRLARARPLPGPRIALIQPAVPHDYSAAQMQFVQMKQMGLARALKPKEVDLVVFPENAVIGLDTPYEHEFESLSKDLRVPLLVGLSSHTEENARRIRSGKPAIPTRSGSRTYIPSYNSAAVITRDGIVAKYDKRHLMPFTEQVPGERLFEAVGLLDRYHALLAGRLGYLGIGVPGRELRLLTIPETEFPPYWTPVCFEQADARLSREAAVKGARSFVNITSEGDLGPQIYWNTTAIAVLRAVELRVGIARCGNMGITSIIDPWGRITDLLRGRHGSLWGEPGVLKGRLPLGTGSPTPYARLGDWPAGVAALALLAAAIRSTRRPRVAA